MLAPYAGEAKMVGEEGATIEQIDKAGRWAKAWRSMAKHFFRFTRMFLGELISKHDDTFLTQRVDSFVFTWVRQFWGACTCFCPLWGFEPTKGNASQRNKIVAWDARLGGSHMYKRESTLMSPETKPTNT